MDKRRSLLGNRAYRWWFIADSACALGVSQQALYMTLAGFDLMRSVVGAGAISMCALLLQRVLTLVGGTVIDRHDRTALLLLYASVQCLIWAMLSELMGGDLLSSAGYCAVIMISSGVSGMLGGSSDALLREVVSDDRYVEARGANEMRDAAFAMMGAPLCGVLYMVGPWAPPVLMSLCFAIASIAAGALLLMRREWSAPGAREMNRGYVCAGGTADVVLAEPAFGKATMRDMRKERSFFNDFFDGLTWFAGNAYAVRVVAVMALVTFAFGIMQYGAQLHLLNSGSSSEEVGFLDAFSCVAVWVGSFFSMRVGARRGAGFSMSAAVVSYGVAAAVLLLRGDFVAIVLALVACSLPMPMLAASVQGDVFLNAPVGMQGRLRAILVSAVQILSAFSSLVAGFGIEAGGTVLLAVLIGLPVLVASVVYKDKDAC